MADRLERVVVQLVEAGRLADVGDVPHGRLALILLDNLAEVLMHREWEDEVHWIRLARGQVALLQSHPRLDDDGQKLLDELATRTVSKTREQAISRTFGGKVSFLAQQGTLDSAHGRVLEKLHAYRNAAYHRDEVRPETLRTAVEIYFFLCCYLMKALPPRMVQMTRPPPTVALVLGTDDMWVTLETQAEVADIMLETRRLDHDQVKLLLRSHALDRLLRMREMLHEWAAGGPWPLTTEGLLHLCQVPEEAVTAPGDLQRLDEIPVPHDMSSFDRWEEQGERIADAPDAIDAMVAFADLEDAFEALEVEIEEMALAMDAIVQDEIDRIRGK